MTKRKTASKPASRKRSTAKKKGKKTVRKRRSSAEKPEIEVTNVEPIFKFVELSISQLSTETGFTRETVSKRLNEAGVVPAGKRRGYPVYRLKMALPARISMPQLRHPHREKPQNC
jgi:hypothetical protein